MFIGKIGVHKTQARDVSLADAPSQTEDRYDGSRLGGITHPNRPVNSRDPPARG